MRHFFALLCVICVGLGLMALAFYTTTHKVGLCAPSNPFCTAHLKSEQGDVHISE